MPFPLEPQEGLTPPGPDEARRRRYMQGLVRELDGLERPLRQGGGLKRIERQRAAGKMLARERIAALLGRRRGVVGTRAVGRARSV